MTRNMLIVLFLMLPSLAFGYDGNELLEDCNEAINLLDNTGRQANPFKAGTCMGYVMATSETYPLLAPKKLCLPFDFKNNQAIRVVVKFLKANPEKLHDASSGLVMDAYFHAFPCK